jgi:hypothetical protein
VGPVSDPLLLRTSGRAGNPTRTSGSVGGNSDHKTIETVAYESGKEVKSGMPDVKFNAYLIRVWHVLVSIQETKQTNSVA